MSKTTKPKFSKLRLNGATRSTPISQFFHKSQEPEEVPDGRVLRSRRGAVSSKQLAEHKTIEEGLRALEEKIKNAAVKITDDKDSPKQKVVSEFFNKAADTSVDDFQDAPTKIAAPAVTPKAKRRCAKKQIDIRKALKRKNVSPAEQEHIELAMAIEQSMIETNPELMDIKKSSLNQFAFKHQPHSEREDINLMDFMPTNSKKCSWGNKITKLTRRDPNVQQLKLEENISRIKEQYFQSAVMPELKSSKYIVQSDFLKPLECPSKRLFTLNGCEESIKENIDSYYVSELFQPSGIECGHLLKDWSSIPGRDISHHEALCDNTKKNCNSSRTANLEEERIFPEDNSINVEDNSIEKEVYSKTKENESIINLNPEISDMESSIIENLPENESQPLRSQSPDMFAEFEESCVSKHKSIIDEINYTLSQSKMCTSTSTIDEDEGIINYQHLSSDEEMVSDSNRLMDDEKVSSPQCHEMEKEHSNNFSKILFNSFETKEKSVEIVLEDNSIELTKSPETGLNLNRSQEYVQEYESIQTSNSFESVNSNKIKEIVLEDSFFDQSKSLVNDLNENNAPTELDVLKDDVLTNPSLSQKANESTSFIKHQESIDIFENNESMRLEVKSQVVPPLCNNKFSDFVYGSDISVMDEIDYLIYKDRPTIIKSLDPTLNVTRTEKQHVASVTDPSIKFDYPLEQSPADDLETSSAPVFSADLSQLDDDDEFIIDYNPPPKPMYKEMDIEELHDHLSSFGIKRLKRDKAIAILDSIYNRTHPFVEDPNRTS